MDDPPAQVPPGPQSAQDPVERILGDCLLGADGDAAARVEAACRRFPEHAAELRERLRLLAEVGFFGDSGSVPHAAIPERLAGFRLLRRIGSGGMGVVYLAHEEALDRTVALKLVRPEHLYFPETRARFQREVRTIAGLRHPGIVPVFAVGEAEGLPFFAMQYVTGQNLQEVLARCHGRPPERLTGVDLAEVFAGHAEAAADAATAARAFGHAWQEVCLRLLVQAAEALDHVHGHGILHRDLKPSNLMVTPGGRVMLLDFGLSATAGADRITRSGALAGSLPYMSPEQVRGGLADLDARTDVYSLGVTLYELLTLCCPYLGADAEDTRRRVLLGQPPPLRERNRAVTWDAETVCLKAMDRDPTRRYPSAGELARDLVRVLEYRPITARRPGPMLRLRRLAQRRPVAAVTAALGSVILLGAPLGWGWLEHGAGLRIAAQREDAERSLQEALRAVRQLLWRVGDTRLRNVPQSLGVRRELLEDALAFCRRLQAGHPGHEVIQRETAAILVQAAGMQFGLGDHDAGQRSLEQSLALLRPLLAAGSDVRADLMQLANAERSMGGLFRKWGRLAEAEQWTRSALARGEELRRRFPGGPEVEPTLGQTCAALAEVLLERGDWPAAEAAAKAAVAILEGCLVRDPQDALATRTLVSALFALGDNRLHGPTPAARDALRRAVVLGRELLGRTPEDVEVLERLAVAEAKLCIVLQDVREYPEAEQLARSAAGHWQRLAGEFPGWVSYQTELGGTLGNLAFLLMRQDRHEEARELHLQAIAAQRRALALSAGHAHALEFLHTLRANLARNLLALDRPAEALALAEPAEQPPATTANHHLQVARLLCACVRACRGKAEDLEDPERSEQADALGRRAVAALEAAVAGGITELARLQQSEFAVLRGRPDYRLLLHQVKAQSRPGR